MDKVNTILAELAPPSTAASTAWEPSVQMARNIRSEWGSEGSVIRDRVLMGFWSAAMARSYDMAFTIPPYYMQSPM